MSLTTENKLSTELRELEEQLSGLIPCAMPESMQARLETSFKEPSDTIEGDLDQLEHHLAGIDPASMQTDMVGRMIRAMETWHEHVPIEEKVIAFDEQNRKTTTPRTRTKSGKGMWSAAAAVAMLGALTALIIPRFVAPQQETTSLLSSPVRKTASPSIAAPQTRGTWLVQDSLTHKVTNASDRGVIISRDNTPHRCIQVDYIDHYKLRDNNGRELDIERPRVDYMLLPVETN